MRKSALSLVLAASACAVESSPLPPISFEGRIDRVSVANFVAAHRDIPSGSTVVMRSAGGDALAAIRLGKFVRTKVMNIEVVEYCISACAQYVLPAAVNKRIGQGAVVAFHSSPSAARKIFATSGVHAGAQLFESAAAADENYLKSLGINPEGLLKAAEIMEPVCIVEDQSKAPTDPQRFGIAWRKSGVVLSIQQLRELGYTNISGDIIDPLKLRETLANLGFIAQFTPSYDPDASLLKDDPEFSPIDFCPATQRIY